MIAGMPGLSELLASDWRKAARFYARLRVTEELVRHGVPVTDLPGENLAERLGSPVDWPEEGRAREAATLP